MQFTSKNLALLAAAASLTSALPTKQAKRDFNSAANNNVAVWWGNSNVLTPLSDICKSGSQDIVILTFAGYSGGAWSEAGNKASADDIKACQSAGKKVMMSIGGETGSVSFSSDADAQKAADAAYDRYLSSSAGVGATLDGIDLDLENRQPAHWDAFVKQIRSKMSKSQFLSGAPQCITPDASLPFDVLNLLDFVWVQYYNNPSCGHGSTGFLDSVKGWSGNLKGPKLYIAGPGSPSSAGSGYIQPDALTKEVADVQALKLDNFGGYAFWDASTAQHNGDYAGVAKKALGGNSGSSSPAPAQSSPAPSPSATNDGHNQDPSSDGTTTVKATSTAVVTSTAFAASSPAAATPTGAAPSKPAASSPAAPAGPTPTGASSGTSCSADGTIVCSADGKQFGVCFGGSATMMSVSDGTVCQNGQIAAASS